MSALDTETVPLLQRQTYGLPAARGLIDIGSRSLWIADNITRLSVGILLESTMNVFVGLVVRSMMIVVDCPSGEFILRLPCYDFQFCRQRPLRHVGKSIGPVYVWTY